MTDLKLLALDDEDLAVISAHVQDSVFKTADIDWSPRGKQFSIAVNRFVWEEALGKRQRQFERRRSALVFKRVNAVRSTGIDRRQAEAVLSLLAVTFEKNGEGPDGFLTLALAGGAEIALDVECIEAQLADIGGAWETKSRPRHPGA